MRSSSIFIEGLNPRRRAYIFGAAAACAAAAGVLAQDLTAYFCVAIPGLFPLLIWLRAGAPGIPALPAISGLFVLYYAAPLLRQDIAAYGSQNLIAAAATVGSFLIAASFACMPFLRRRGRQAPMSAQSFVSNDQIVIVVFVGLACGIVYNLALISGNLAWMGAFASLLRPVVFTLSSVACYLLGCARASGALVGQRWTAALLSLAVLVLLSLGNFFLISAIMNVLAAVFGYVITAKRIPWILLGLAFAVVSILHAGKYEMRRTYWTPQSQSLQESSVFQIPGMMVDWFTKGIAAIGSSSDREPDILERASLLHMVLLVQRTTPGVIPHLEGETYALLPAMVVPRFLEPDKPVSQAGLNLLSVRYGLQTVESTLNTTIGWGLVAEAYANFGFAGVISVGALFGAFCGFVMRLSTGAAPLSLPMFFAIATTLTLFNVEMDFSYLVVTLTQTMAAVLVLATLPHLLPGRRRQARARASLELGAMDARYATRMAPDEPRA